MHRLATIHNVTDRQTTDRRNTVPIARPLVRSAQNGENLANITNCLHELMNTLTISISAHSHTSRKGELYQKHKHQTPVISRPTPRLLSFALCLEWINGIYMYNTPDTDCLECCRPHASVNKTMPKTVKIVNKRLRNLLNEIQNVFINGKQVKTAKITQIIP